MWGKAWVVGSLCPFSGTWGKGREGMGHQRDGTGIQLIQLYPHAWTGNGNYLGQGSSAASQTPSQHPNPLPAHHQHPQGQFPQIPPNPSSQCRTPTHLWDHPWGSSVFIPGCSVCSSTPQGSSQDSILWHSLGMVAVPSVPRVAAQPVGTMTGGATSSFPQGRAPMGIAVSVTV